MKQIGKDLAVSNDSLTNDTYFRVICVTYKERKNDVVQQNKLKVAGFESFFEMYRN